MKRLISMSILCLLLVISSCKKDDQDKEEDKTIIGYSIEGNWGANILAMSDSTELFKDTEYSICANIGDDATLRVLIFNLSDNSNAQSPADYAIWFISDLDNNGWNTYNFDDESNSQEFNAANTGEIDRRIKFSAVGLVRIEVYENSSENASKTLIITWK